MKSTLSIVVLHFFIGIVVCHGQNSQLSNTTDRQQIAFLGNFKLESGQVIQNCKIGYRTYGHLNSAKTNGILFLSWFGGTAKDIEQEIAPWKAVDTNKYFLILADALGNGVSSSPSNSIKQHGPNFPMFSIRDMVESQHHLLIQKLGINHLQAVMGISMGGFQTFQWAVSYPDFMYKLIPIVGSPQPGSYDLMLMNTRLKIVEADTGFNHGNYKVNPVILSMIVGSELNSTTPAHIIKTMSRDSFAVWLRKEETMKNYEGQDWNDFYYQLKACIGQDIAKPYNSSLKDAASHIKAKMLIISSKQDHLVNPAPAIEFSKLLPAKLVVIDSEWGHLAFSFDDPEIKQSIIEILTGD